MNLPKPKKQISEVLYELITRPSINRKYMFNETGILNVTARIANLRNIWGLDIVCTKIDAINKHGRKIQYGEWSLSHKDEAIIIYNQINNG